MNTTILYVILAVLVAALLLGFYRLARGPTVVDRIMGFDAVVLCAIALTAVLSRHWHSDLIVELILIVSSLGFISTVAFVFFLQRALPYGGEESAEDGEEDPE